MQALAANNLETLYWTPGVTAQQEAEFVVQNRRGQIIPIEVKSGDNVRSRLIMERKNGALTAIRQGRRPVCAYYTSSITATTNATVTSRPPTMMAQVTGRA